ncbi:protein BTG2-like [Tachypleus tridentatus]|uniref:protein BTG2-like n=1 Tax=Tachypleus tridentatus TaxID=6853 RepID=UPI003FCFB627
MRQEIQSATDFLTSLLRLKKSLDSNQLEMFRNNLENMLKRHYQQHWFPDKPFKGSGYRCIRINHKMDPVIAKAGKACGLDEARLREEFPNELSLWIDPREVSYRIGENGSICIIYEGSKLSSESLDSRCNNDKDVSSFPSENGSYHNGSQLFLPNLRKFPRASCKDNIWGNMSLEQLAAYVSS